MDRQPRTPAADDRAVGAPRYAYPAAGAGASEPNPVPPGRAVVVVPPSTGRARVVVGGALLLAGAWLVAAPFVLGYAGTGSGGPATVNDVLTGVAVVLVAGVGLLVRTRGTVLGAVGVALGAWLLAAPFVLFHSADAPAVAATWNDILTGGVVVVLAVARALAARRASTAAGHDLP